VDTVDLQMISHYRIIKQLGAGGMGEVYLAEDMKLNRKVAIKFLPRKSLQNEEAKQGLMREAQAAARLDHPNICIIHEEVEEDNHCFIVMQYVEGQTLYQRMQTKSLTLRESLDILIQVADALAEAHSHGVIHRDIKPQNIIVTPRGQVKVLDFGLAKIVPMGQAVNDEAVTQKLLADFEFIVGTVPYMSPEQASGALVDERSDLFSLGTVMYQCLAGQAPFSGANSIETAGKLIHVDPPPPSQFNLCVSPELDRITLKALAKRPETRYQSARELSSDLVKVRDMLQNEDSLALRHGSRIPGGLRVRTFKNVYPKLCRPQVLFAGLLVAIFISLLGVTMPRLWPSPAQSSNTETRRSGDVSKWTLHEEAPGLHSTGYSGPGVNPLAPGQDSSPNRPSHFREQLDREDFPIECPDRSDSQGRATVLDRKHVRDPDSQKQSGPGSKPTG
jgi:serine/threonine protein kinase